MSRQGFEPDYYHSYCLGQKFSSNLMNHILVYTALLCWPACILDDIFSFDIHYQNYFPPVASYQLASQNIIKHSRPVLVAEFLELQLEEVGERLCLPKSFMLNIRCSNIITFHKKIFNWILIIKTYHKDQTTFTPAIPLLILCCGKL